jgi:hypothetical protein
VVPKFAIVGELLAKRHLHFPLVPSFALVGEPTGCRQSEARENEAATEAASNLANTPGLLRQTLNGEGTEFRVLVADLPVFLELR